MTFNFPAANNDHNVDPDLNARRIANVGSPASVATKSAGNLPITDIAGQWQNDTVGDIEGVVYDFQASQASYNVSVDTRLLLWHNQCNAPNRIQVDSVANEGYAIRIYSGTGAPPANYRRYNVGGNDTPAATSISGQYPCIIDLNSDSHDAEIGTYDNTAVTAYAFTTHKFDMAGTNDNWSYPGRSYVLTTTKTGSDTPSFTGTSNPQDAVDQIQGSDYTDKLGNWVRKIGSVIFIDFAFRIGDNSAETDFNDNGLIIVSPQNNDSADPRARLTDQACRTYLNLRNNAADTAVFSGTWIWGTRAPFDWDQDDLASVTFNNPNFTGMGDFTLGSSVSGSATFNNVGVVIMADNGVDLDGSVFRNPHSNHLLQLSA